MVRIGLWATLMLKPRRTFATFSEKNFGVGQDNQTGLVGIIHFLSFIQLAAIVNEINRVVISGEGFRYTRLVSLDASSSVEGMFFARSMRVRMTECLCWGWWCDLKSR